MGIAFLIHCMCIQEQIKGEMHTFWLQKCGMQTVAETNQQIRTAFGTYDHVILTDESIWHALSYSKKSLLQELKKEADEQKYQIKVIVYLRRQDGLLISRWNQEVKQNFNSVAVMTCEEYLAASEKKEKKIYQYEKII